MRELPNQLRPVKTSTAKKNLSAHDPLYYHPNKLAKLTKQQRSIFAAPIAKEENENSLDHFSSPKYRK